MCLFSTPIDPDTMISAGVGGERVHTDPANTPPIDLIGLGCVPAYQP